MNPDVQRTRAYYASISAEELCQCAYCTNFYRQVRKAYPEAAAYLDRLGADIEKPLDTSPLEPGEDGMLEYVACQYVVFGRGPDTYRERIGGLEVRIAQSHPNTGISAEHFVVELYPVRLKWIME